MAYCRTCGSEIHNEAVICPSCGVSQKQVTDNGGFGYGVLGCCVPVAGLVLYLIWKDEKPKTAKALGIGTLVYLICMALYILAIFLIAISNASNM